MIVINRVLIWFMKQEFLEGSMVLTSPEMRELEEVD